MHLTKSDFKVARTCETKLYYRQRKYPSTRDGDEYLEFLADGGYMVEEIAKLLYPDGQELPHDSTANALAASSTALTAQQATLFEVTFCSGVLLARVDILKKVDSHFDIIEVKAKSVEIPQTGSPFRGKNGGILAKWRPYLEDVAFQTLIVKHCLPQASVTPHLCLVDKAATCPASSVFQHFQLKRVDGQGGALRRPLITFNGNSSVLGGAGLVKVLNVEAEVDELLPLVEKEAKRFAKSLASGNATRIPHQLGVHCKKCEYRDAATAQNPLDGFRECWGKLADHEPHLLDLYRVDKLGTNGAVAQRLIRQKKVSLLNVRDRDLRGKLGDRQRIQLRGTRTNREFIDPQLRAELKTCQYPLHFIDFEGCRMAVPFHAGMQPYEQVLFQWSCHTIPTPGGKLQHSAWINVKDVYPNFKFAQSLRKAMKLPGTVFVWSSFENSALDDVREQLEKYGQNEPTLNTWLKEMTDASKTPTKDMYKLASKYYFHPLMKGSLSIKDVLPAVWLRNKKLHRHPWFSKYVPAKGPPVDPYQTLDKLPFGDDDMTDTVREGTAAIRTYQDMLYGVNRDDRAYCTRNRERLLNYCELDTAAMVMIWLRWTGQV